MLVPVAVRLLAALALAGLAAGTGRGQEEPAPVAEPVVGAPAAVAPAAVAKPSARDNLRDPFWPVDFVRPAQPGERTDPDAAAKIGELEWRALEKTLLATIKGTSRLPTRSGAVETLVMVNGKFVGTNDVVSLSANGKTYRWKIVSISLRDGPVFERIAVAHTAAQSKR